MTICKLGLTSSSIAQHLSIIVHLDATWTSPSMGESITRCPISGSSGMISGFIELIIH